MPGDCKKATVTSIFRNGKKEDAWNYMIPGKVMGQLILETIYRHLNNITKGKSCLTSLINCDKRTAKLDEGRAMDIA